MPLVVRETSRQGLRSEMPPPSRKRYREGTQECLKALRDGIIELSLPEYAAMSITPFSSSLDLTIDNSDVEPAVASAVSLDIRSNGIRKVGTTNDGDGEIHSTDESSTECDALPQQDLLLETNVQEVCVPNGAIVSPGGSLSMSEDNSIGEVSASACAGSDMANYEAPPKFHQPDPSLPRFSDIIGHGAAKLRIEEVLLPIALPPSIGNSILSGIRSMPASILLHGPPGVGKTKLARAIAGEAEAAFLSIGPGDILSKFVGESEASLRAIFKRARDEALCMESKCSVLFFDEIDALGQSRGSSDQSGGASDNSGRRLLAELLLQMNRISNQTPYEEAGCQRMDDESIGEAYFSTAESGMGSSMSYPSTSVESGSSHARVIVVAATNRPDDCDPALLRRFGIRVEIGLPNETDRRRILKRLLKDISHTITKFQLRDLACSLEGYSGSELENLAREATMAPVRECIRVAARKKRCARRSNDGRGSPGHGDPHQLARDCLLGGLQNMRAVSISDFEAAVAFSNGNQEEDGDERNTATGHQTVHYDSSSGSEEEEA